MQKHTKHVQHASPDWKQPEQWSQTTLNAVGIDLWAVPALYALVKEVAPRHGFDALLADAQVTIQIEAVGEHANLEALLEDLDNRGLSMGRGHIDPPASSKGGR